MEGEKAKMPVGLKWTIIGISLIVALILVAILNPFVIVKAGYRGVVLTWGAVSGVMDEGLHLRIPFAQHIEKLEVRTVKMEVPALAYSKDIQTVDSLIALNYHLDPSNVGKLYKEIGEDFESRVISPAVQESVKAITAKYTAQELIEKRELVRDEIKGLLTERLAERSMLVDAFSIVNFDFSDEYEKAVESKQVAQQSALKAQNDLDRVKKEAEQRVAQAEAEARAIKIQAEAITQQGGEDYVNLKAVEKWNGVLPTQMIPNATLPFINLNK